MNSVKFSLFDSTVMTDVFHGILLLPIHLITNHSYLTISSSVVLLYFSYSLIVSLFFFYFACIMFPAICFYYCFNEIFWNTETLWQTIF